MLMAFLPVASAYGQVAPQQEGLVHMVTGTGLVVQGVLYLLIGFSIASWGVIFFKLRQIRTARTQSGRFIEVFWDYK